MSDEEAKAAEEIRARAKLAGVAIRPEHLAGVVLGWSLIQPHLERVNAVALDPLAEPAALFRP